MPNFFIFFFLTNFRLFSVDDVSISWVDQMTSGVGHHGSGVGHWLWGQSVGPNDSGIGNDSGIVGMAYSEENY